MGHYYDCPKCGAENGPGGCLCPKPGTRPTMSDTDLREVLRLLIADERLKMRPASYEADAILALFKERGWKVIKRPTSRHLLWFDGLPDYPGADKRRANA